MSEEYPLPPGCPKDAYIDTVWDKSTTLCPVKFKDHIEVFESRNGHKKTGRIRITTKYILKLNPGVSTEIVAYPAYIEVIEKSRKIKPDGFIVDHVVKAHTTRKLQSIPPPPQEPEQLLAPDPLPLLPTHDEMAMLSFALFKAYLVPGIEGSAAASAAATDLPLALRYPWLTHYTPPAHDTTPTLIDRASTNFIRNTVDMHFTEKIKMWLENVQEPYDDMVDIVPAENGEGEEMHNASAR
ncbi:hypothetical protein BS50DRAFT_659816 [Corynespora cassiicola Philippines]|uniref:Uncharacterized protein n=1 Tax=Corynespora cassiicola Philippines TaxID=1448308 RepID=A0A2T2P076_CORCC|nr:hypothetical protein BS50DRAFT_659816 [Corynespora cassiicola Philippines]